MNSLFKVGEFGGIALLLGFFGVIVWKMISGEIPLDGLLESTDSSGQRSYSIERAQLLVLTLVVAGKYVLAALHNPNRNSLPDVPAEFVALLAGSQAIYVGGKAWSRLGPLLKKMK